MEEEFIRLKKNKLKKMKIPDRKRLGFECSI